MIVHDARFFVAYQDVDVRASAMVCRRFQNNVTRETSAHASRATVIRDAEARRGLAVNLHLY